ncbi:YihY/virulence factor BrkB family protein [bacterium]|nr:YihY/virulence factor BrkB family protein [bacterium]
MITPTPQQAIRDLSRLPGLWWRVLRAGYLRFGFGGAPLLAAAVSFYAVISLGPLVLLIASLLQLILGPGGNSYQWLRQALSDLAGSAVDQILPAVDGLLTNPDAYVAGAISLAMVLWGGHRLFDTIERSLTGIWPGGRFRGILHRKLVCLTAMAVACVLLAAFVVLEAGLAAAAAWLSRFPQVDRAALTAARTPLVVVGEFLTCALAFGLLYKFMPVQKVPTRVAAVGALWAAVLWVAASPLFAFSVSHTYQRGALYGGLAGVVVFSFWALLGAEVLMFGAHFALAYEHVFVLHRPPEEDNNFAGVRPSTGPEEPADRLP